ncbi:DUF6415 family natural product biosynthesis protein [Streptomyces syringium]|uniref:DUF6415 family natural product biosynthesis protein n=1 Tax=Streptomyces syringium TaxID=76729 RepID=UPI0033CF1E91
MLPSASPSPPVIGEEKRQPGEHWSARRAAVWSPPWKASGLMRALLQLRPRAQDQEALKQAIATVDRVLIENLPVPDVEQADELELQLRGHLMELVAILTAQAGDHPLAPHQGVIARAREAREAQTPRGEMGPQIHLVRLAEITQELLAHILTGQPQGTGGESGAEGRTA